MAPVTQAANGICYAVSGEVTAPAADLERLVSTVPRTIAAALDRKAYYFVPLTLNLGDETLIADRYDVQLSDSAICHRNQTVGDSQCVFISTRLMEDSFAIAFEFFINIGHNFVDESASRRSSPTWCGSRWRTGCAARPRWTPTSCAKLQPPTGLRRRRRATNTCWRPLPTPSRCICCRCIWTWITRSCASATIRCSPPDAMAERLRKINELFPPNPGFEFAVYHRRRQ